MRHVRGIVLLAGWLAAVSFVAAPRASLLTNDAPRITKAERLSALERGQVWHRTNVPSMNVVTGPPGGYAPEATVRCEYEPHEFTGEDPKFDCTTASGKSVKVRYGAENGEVYAGVAATRLLWALGFGADVLYPVHVVCAGCPEKMQTAGMATGKTITFAIAAVERKYPAPEIDANETAAGWSWPELDRVSEAKGGAPRAERDALKLLMAMLQHTDSKAIQQRIVCEGGDRTTPAATATCAHPFLLVHDVGHTFAHARVLTPENAHASLGAWSAAPVWKDRARCVAGVTPNSDGTLRDPVISERGRRFLSGLLAQLTDRQLHDLFAVARFDRGAHAGDSVDAWVAAFARKRAAIAAARCPAAGVQ